MNPTNADIRQFILDAFSDEDFEVFCADYFRDAQVEFASSLSLRIKALRLIEYCQNRGLLDNLLAALQQERPERYAQRFTLVTPAATAPAAAAQPIVRNPRQIFISHAHADTAFAHRLASDLRQHGWPVWIAPESIHPGEKWVAAIERGLAESGIFLAVVTPDALGSRWVRAETQEAISLEYEGLVRLIPLQARPAQVSGFLRGYQYVSFLNRYEDGLDKLLNALGSREAGSPVAASVDARSGPEPVEAVGPPKPIGEKTLASLIRSRQIPVWGWATAMLALAMLIGFSILAPQLFLAPAATASPASSSAPSSVALLTASPATGLTATSIPGPTNTPSPTHTPKPASTETPVPPTTPVDSTKELVLALAPGITMPLVHVPAGEFLMGSDSAKDKVAEIDEQPQHSVYVSEFYIGKYEVTVAQFAAFVQATGYKTAAEKEGGEYDWQHPGGPGSDVTWKQNHPVVQVDWEDAVAFGRWLSQTTGRSVGLPAEAEWEKAARGTDGRIYPWGDEWDEKRLNSRESPSRDTTPVGQYSPAGDSPYGAADMAGNVWEWVADWFGEDEYKQHTQTSSPVKDPTGPVSGAFRVLRGGGSWFELQTSARCSARGGNGPVFRGSDLGFRVVVRPAPVP